MSSLSSHRFRRSRSLLLLALLAWCGLIGSAFAGPCCDAPPAGHAGMAMQGMAMPGMDMSHGHTDCGVAAHAGQHASTGKSAGSSCCGAVYSLLAVSSVPSLAAPRALAIRWAWSMPDATPVVSLPPLRPPLA